MDRGFFSLSRIAQLKPIHHRYVVLLIKNNVTVKMLKNVFFGKKGSEKIEAKVVIFSDIESKTKFLVTNLLATGEGVISPEQIGEFYRMRWQIELFWKLLKMP
jgi:hypothetical protein